MLTCVGTIFLTGILLVILVLWVIVCSSYILPVCFFLNTTRSIFTCPCGQIGKKANSKFTNEEFLATAQFSHKRTSNILIGVIILDFVVCVYPRRKGLKFVSHLAKDIAYMEGDITLVSFFISRGLQPQNSFRSMLKKKKKKNETNPPPSAYDD